MKTCKKCKIEKPFNEFHKHETNSDKLTGSCKECYNNARLENYHKDPNKQGEYYKKNKDEITIKSKNRYYAKREYILENKKIYFQKNKAARYRYFVKKYNTNLNFNIKMKLSVRIRSALRANNTRKNNRTVEYLGISIPEFRKHLEKQFYVNLKTGEMMSWENIKKWHIDHIIPCASYNLIDINAQKKCFHYTNLRPLWAEENLRKGDKFII